MGKGEEKVLNFFMILNLGNFFVLISEFVCKCVCVCVCVCVCANPYSVDKKTVFFGQL
jgi:hypothetical protein